MTKLPRSTPCTCARSVNGDLRQEMRADDLIFTVPDAARVRQRGRRAATGRRDRHRLPCGQRRGPATVAPGGRSGGGRHRRHRSPRQSRRGGTRAMTIAPRRRRRSTVPYPSSTRSTCRCASRSTTASGSTATTSRAKSELADRYGVSVITTPRRARPPRRRRVGRTATGPRHESDPPARTHTSRSPGPHCSPSVPSPANG